MASTKSNNRKHLNEFAKLKADCEKIVTQLDMPPLPIKRSIEQVAETSRRLAAKTTGAEQVAAKNKGLVACSRVVRSEFYWIRVLKMFFSLLNRKYLLAKKVDVVELDRLKDIEIKTAFVPQVSIEFQNETDEDEKNRAEKEQTIVLTIF